MVPSSCVHTLDLRFQDLPEAIAAYAVVGPSGAFLVECGPMSCLPRLLMALAERGLAPEDIGDVFLTHIHLDHAGSAGWWAALGARIHVHPAGAKHLVDPSRLLASATMVYGEAMHALWGEVPPVDGGRVRVLTGGEAVSAAGLVIRAWESLGHARHHMAFQLGRQLFTGDAGGIRLPGHSLAIAPTPPPDLDLAAWRASLDRMAALRPTGLYLTHFGRVDDPAAHLAEVRRALDADEAWLEAAEGMGHERGALVEAYRARQAAALDAEGITGSAAEAYLAANPAGMAVDGLRRWLTSRGSRASETDKESTESGEAS